MKAVPPPARPAAGLLAPAPSSPSSSACAACAAAAAVTLGIAAVLAPRPAAAEGWRWSGYGTAAAVQVQAPAGWKFLRDITQRRNADEGVHLHPDSRIGLQVNWQPDEQWELVAQAVGRERAKSAPLRESLEWAFVAWRPAPQWQVRVGRTSPDLFLLADYRNVGFAYPWVRPPVEGYGWMPFYSMDGADVSWRGTVAGAGWTARAFAGRTQATMAGGSGYGDPVVRSPRLFGATLSREHDGLTVKVTAARAWSTLSDTVGLGTMRNALAQLAAAGLPQVSDEAAAVLAGFGEPGFSTRYLSVGTSWERGPWTLQGEWTRIGGSYRAHNATFAYLSAARRFGDLTLFTLAGRAWPAESARRDPQWGPRVAPLVGPVMAAQIQGLGQALAEIGNVGRHDQRSLSLGARWDLRPNLAWKLQVDRVRVAADGTALWSSPAGGQSARATLTTTSLDVVF